MSSIDIPNKISVSGGGFHDVNGIYEQRSPAIIPAGFDRTCRAMNWDTEQMWKQLSDQSKPWYESENESYIYWNRGDGKLWIDGPSGSGVYIAKNDGWTPPKSGWVSLSYEYEPTPTVVHVEDEAKEEL
mmetsp:Transcript_946/g.1365  ORF Transcript_946/g.1365 Transcript_946/m.1365 type:complete len:129 (+) Transcript_946:380-766(+)